MLLILSFIAPQANVIHEDIENEDKISRSSSSEDEYQVYQTKKDIKSAAIEGVSETRKLITESKSGEGAHISKVNRIMSESDRNKKNDSLGLKVNLKRSNTSHFKKKHFIAPESPKVKSKIVKLLKSVNLERQLHSHSHGENLASKPVDEESEDQGIADYRRKGYLKQRRLSRINLGKQLALSDTSGLKLQWIVDYKDYQPDENLM